LLSLRFHAEVDSVASLQKEGLFAANSKSHNKMAHWAEFVDEEGKFDEHWNGMRKEAKSALIVVPAVGKGWLEVMAEKVIEAEELGDDHTAFQCTVRSF